MLRSKSPLDVQCSRHFAHVLDKFGHRGHDYTERFMRENEVVAVKLCRKLPAQATRFNFEGSAVW